MENTSETPPLRIAIVGGGLAGATLANVLLKHPHLDVQIYESAPEFSERGSAVGLSTNAQNALAEMSPDLIETLHAAGAVPMSSSRIVTGSGPHAGEIILDVPVEKQSLIVHRAALLSGLLKPIPRTIMHANKKLVSVDETENRDLILHFQDGSKGTFDALIGADGVHGHVREHILGADHPATKAAFAGFWDCRLLVPFEKAKAKLGEVYFRENRQYSWVGNGGFFLHDVLDNEATVQCIASAMTDADWGADEWKRDLDSKACEESFGNWDNSPIASNMVEVSNNPWIGKLLRVTDRISRLLENPKLRAYPQYHHETDAPTYARGRVCMMGDSAHTTTPWQGSGAGLAIEDAMILDTLLKEVKEPHQLNAAFKSYDIVRRPRSQQVIASSKITGRIMCGKGPEIGLDPQKIREALAPRWGFILGLDMKSHKEEALAKFRAMSPERA